MIPIANHELNRELAVWRPFLDPDGAGGQVVTMLQVGEVRGRVSQPSAAEQLVAAQAGAVHTYAVYLKPDAEVFRGDELRDAGQVFRVKATYRPSEAVYLRADCELDEPEPEAEES